MSKIYHLLDEAEPFSEINGGAISRWVANTLRYGNETVVCPSFDGSWGFPTDRLYRLPNWNLCNRIHPALYRSPWTLQRKIYLHVFVPLINMLKRGDILYIHNRPECADALAAIARQRGIRLVLHMHNSLLHPRSRKHFPALKQIPVVFCSEFLRKEVVASFPHHFQTTHVVYNGADNDKFYPGAPRSNSIPEIVFTGRLIPQKGAHVLMGAMSILERRGVAANCKIVGGSAFGNSRRTRYIRRLQRTRPHNTELTGYRSGNDLADVLRSANVFCCPSIWNDPFPLAPLEAMASGLPVVASRTGGLPEALAHGGGIMVPPNDEKALAEALQQLLENPAYRERLGAEALDAFRGHFLWVNVREGYESFVRGLAS